MTDVARYENVARGDVLRVWREIGERFPGRVVIQRIEHDDGCPCLDGGHSMLSCVCSKVDLVVEQVR